MYRYIFIITALVSFTLFSFAQAGPFNPDAGGGPFIDQNNPQIPNMMGTTGINVGQQVVMLNFEKSILDNMDVLRGKEIMFDALLVSISGENNCRLRFETLTNEVIVVATTDRDTKYISSIGKTVTVNATISINSNTFTLTNFQEDEDSIKDIIDLVQQDIIIDVPVISVKAFNMTDILMSTTPPQVATVTYSNIEEEIIACIPIYAAQIKKVNSKVTDNDATEIATAILVSSWSNDIDPRLLFALIQAESRFNKNAVSRSGAQGLGQLMPGTARELGVTNSFNVAQNIEGSAKYISKQLTDFGGDLTKALAAYNAGPARVRQANGVPNIRETRNYVEIIWREYLKLTGSNQ